MGEYLLYSLTMPVHYAEVMVYKCIRTHQVSDATRFYERDLKCKLNSLLLALSKERLWRGARKKVEVLSSPSPLTLG